MIIKITDIPPQGRDLKFELNNVSLNERVETSRSRTKSVVLPPQYLFHNSIIADLHFELEGSTAIISGRTRGAFHTNCARCLEDVTEPIDIPIDLILKPRTTRGPLAARDDDLNFGYYDGQAIDCGSYVEEFLILALPYSVLCSPDCRGLCSVCGANLNASSCTCHLEKVPDGPFACLQGYKPMEKLRIQEKFNIAEQKTIK